MMGERSRYGLSVSVLGAVVLAVAVFLPWYGEHLAVNGGTLYGHAEDQLVSYRTLHAMSVLMLALAGLALLDAVTPLARPHAPVPGGAGGSVAVLGVLGVALVAYRMAHPPALAGGVSVSLAVGPWLALLGALAMVVGGLWPRGALVPALSS